MKKSINPLLLAVVPVVFCLALLVTSCKNESDGLLVGSGSHAVYKQSTGWAPAEMATWEGNASDSDTEGTSADDTEDTNGSTTNTEEESISETIISSGITADAILGCSEESVITLTSLNDYFVYTAPVGGRQYRVRTTKVNEFLKTMQPCTPYYCPKFSHIVIGADGFVKEEINLDLEVGVKALLDVNKDGKFDIVVEVTEVFPNQHLRLAVRGDCKGSDETNTTPAEEINEAFETDDDNNCVCGGTEFMWSCWCKESILPCETVEEDVITLTPLNKYFVYTAPLKGKQYGVRVKDMMCLDKVMMMCAKDQECPPIDPCFSEVEIFENSDGIGAKKIFKLDLHPGQMAKDVDFNYDGIDDIRVKFLKAYPNQHLDLAVGVCDDGGD